MFELNASHFYGFQSINLMVTFDEGWCMDLISVFPGVVTLRVALPFNQILQGLMVSPSLVSMDLFHLIFLFSINQIRGRLDEVRAM
jgi:hypothetical protein